MSASFLKEIAERRTRDVAALEQLNSQIEELQAEAALISQTLTVYDKLLGATSRGLRGRPRVKQAGSSRAGKRRRSTRAQRGSKTGAVMELIAKRGEQGASPAEIYSGIQTLGMEDFGKNYLYTILHKLKGRKRLREKGGRYFLLK
jgi:hypothetical protein